MTPVSTRRLRLGAAVAAVLAVTAGGLATAVPAAAAAPSAVSASASAVVPYPKEDPVLIGAGATGFLTWVRSDDRMRAVWTRYDGTTSEPWSFDESWITASRASDVIVRVGSDGTITLRDMATGQDVLSVRARNADFLGAVGRSVFVKASNSQGGHDVHLLAPGDDGKVADDTVTGLPPTAKDPRVRAATSDTALLTYTTSTGGHWATVDLATAQVTGTGAMTSDLTQTPIALSGTHVAWLGPAAGGVRTAVVTERKAAPATQRITLPGAVDSLGLVGGWLTYGQTGGYGERNPSPTYAVTARSLATGVTRKLMDDSDSSVAAPDGSLIVQGGTLEDGEGLYRIAPGANGEPAATQVASSGLSTKVTLLGHDIPAVVDLDRTGGRLAMVWRLSRSEVEMTLRIRNTRTGETLTDGVYPLNGDYDPHRAAYTWNGQLTWNNTRDMWTGAASGPYTWEITAKPMNGIGPELKSSGAFTVTRKPGLHDYDADGSPDVLVRDTTGRLWIDDTFPNPYAGYVEQNPGLLVGSGWNAYDRIEAVGNIAGSAVSDVVARDKAGVLWLYQGTGNAKAPLATRVRVGSGWGAYPRLTGGSDLTGDGRADLVAADTAGDLYLYKGTGSATAPFAARKRIGTGWGAYNQLTATGNLAGDPAGDLVARDAAGVLWLYLGKGDGTFAPRVRVGAGWGAYDRLLGVGDANRDGRPDLYASVKGGGGSAYVYKGTGSWKQPFLARDGVAWYSSAPDIRYDLLS
ncbi:FG-GAP repeat domain-containing protein [Streptomyces sp. NBC_00691]|uniref:FG-GAP repeat domain-containing protein n=1 Tax=Streptomyces sp. NBC_00691 TaxID=2903671 RepID=UPI002E3142A3|nr:VCBS repeat-containing protein [Streptomyces sp. NBC_00691]